MVVVRLRNLEANDVLRLFDYMMGAVLALEGELVRPAATTVVLIPKDVELDEDELEPDDEDELDWIVCEVVCFVTNTSWLSSRFI